MTRGNDLSFRNAQPACRGSPGHRRRSGPATSGACACGAAGPAASPCRSPGRRAAWAPCPVARAPRAGCCPAGGAGCLPPPWHGCAAAASRSSSPGGVPGDLAGRAADISRRPGTPARCLAARARRRPASAAGARTVSRLMPATGSGRDAIPGPAPDDRPASPSRAAGSGHDTGAAVTCAFTAMARIWRGCPGHPRSCRHGLAGLALAGCQCLCGQPLVPTGPPRPIRIFSNYTRSSWSPVTESNRRPSPYHGQPASLWPATTLDRMLPCLRIRGLEGLGVARRGWPWSPLIVPTTG